MDDDVTGFVDIEFGDTEFVDIEFGDTEFVDMEFVDMQGCFVVEGIIGIMRPGVICDVIGVAPSDVIGGLEYGEL